MFLVLLAKSIRARNIMSEHILRACSSVSERDIEQVTLCSGKRWCYIRYEGRLRLMPPRPGCHDDRCKQQRPYREQMRYDLVNVRHRLHSSGGNLKYRPVRTNHHANPFIVSERISEVNKVKQHKARPASTSKRRASVRVRQDPIVVRHTQGSVSANDNTRTQDKRGVRIDTIGRRCVFRVGHKNPSPEDVDIEEMVQKVHVLVCGEWTFRAVDGTREGIVRRIVRGLPNLLIHPIHQLSPSTSCSSNCIEHPPFQTPAKYNPHLPSPLHNP